MSVRRIRPALVATVLGAPLALALVACGSDDGTSSADQTVPVAADSSSSSASAPESTSESAPSSPAAPLDDAALLAAARTALDEVAGSTVFSVDRDNGGWEVQVVSGDGTESELSLGADGQDVTRGPVADGDDADDADDLAERRQLLQDATVTYAAALETARAEVPGLAIDGVDLDLETGTATWDVQLGEDTADEQTVRVDAATGDVLGVERDD